MFTQTQVIELIEDKLSAGLVVVASDKHYKLSFLLPQDTDVIVWDIINECGLYRLRGHKDVITQALFLKDKNLLVTW